MTQQKSPGRQARARTKKGSEQATPLYPAATAPVNRNCFSCQYFREFPRARWKKLFCQFTGESVSETWGCEHWASGGGEL